MNEEQFKKDIRGYENLSKWNEHDANAVLIFDRIFIPLILIGVITVAINNLYFFPPVCAASWLPLWF